MTKARLRDASPGELFLSEMPEILRRAGISREGVSHGRLL
jgi:hypothetical protein